jgi:hypothetical protein
MSSFSRSRDATPIPQPLAVLDAKCTDKTNRTVIAATGADNDLILVDVGSHRIPAVAGITTPLHIPHLFAGRGVEGEDPAVLGRDEHLASGQADPTVYCEQQYVSRVVGCLSE